MMFVAAHGGNMEFGRPELDAPMNWRALTDALPKDVTIRGMFMQDLVDDLRKAGRPVVGAKSYSGFKSVPMRDYYDLLRYCCAELHPRESERRALFGMGRQIYPRFASSLVGKSIFTFAGNDFARMAALAPKAYEVSASRGRVKIAELRDDGYALVELRDVWTLVDVMQVGTWEGAMEVARVQGQVLVRSLSLCDADLEVRWQPRQL